MRGGGGSVDFGEITWFSGGKMGAVRRILGRSHGFQGEKKGGGGKSVVTNGV